MAPRLMAVSDLHVGHERNKRLVEGMRPADSGDWLIVAGDVAELFSDIEWGLGLLARRYERVIWAPGNHELWAHPSDPVTLRGDARYRALVEMCRSLGVLTPEDGFAVWRGHGGPVAVAPLFTLYDYSFRVPEATSKEHSLRLAYEAGVVCTDEELLHPDPYPTREEWCWARLAESERRLSALELPTVLVTHWPLVRRPTDILWYPVFAQWCGSVLTADWHTRFRAEVAVYGHLHIPRSAVYDGVRFEEVSLGYPREWERRALPPPLARPVFPDPPP
jgi:3',5'-cyclic AMP phosphodiesterase CpdA